MGEVGGGDLRCGLSLDNRSVIGLELDSNNRYPHNRFEFREVLTTGH